MPKRIICLIICIAMVAASLTICVNAQAVPSNWAKDGVYKLQSRGIVPKVLQTWYEGRINREEFATLCVNTLSYTNEREIISTNTPFKDINGSTWKKQIEFAYLRGIVSGTSANTFTPLGYLTREQCAVMIVKLLTNIEGWDVMSGQYSSNVPLDGVSSWATKAVTIVSSLSLMVGTGNGFSPKQILTRQEAMYILYKVLCLYYNMDSNPKIPILMYHNIVPNSAKGNDLNIPVSQFESNLATLKNAGYRAMLPREVSKALTNGKLPKKPIMITFDDGYDSCYWSMYPLLKKYEMKATVFVIVSELSENGGSNMMSIPECKEMVESGYVSIQSHTNKLHAEGVLRRNGESFADYRLRLLADCADVKYVIEDRIGDKLYAFSYPHGWYNSEAESVLAEAGFQFTFCTNDGVSRYITYGRTNEIKRLGVGLGVTGQTLLGQIQRALNS